MLAPEVPPRIIDKAPTAELRPDQTDQDSLPAYDVLDAILHGFIEETKSIAEIVDATGHERELVEKVVRLVYNSEFKRRQSAPGPKISAKAFDKDRRYPITNAFLKYA